MLHCNNGQDRVGDVGGPEWTGCYEAFACAAVSRSISFMYSGGDTEPRDGMVGSVPTELSSTLKIGSMEYALTISR
jgi:hypothetical protein